MNTTIGFIGYGSMGQLLLAKLLESNKVRESDVFISNRTLSKISELPDSYPKINICEDNIALAARSRIIFLCVKLTEMKDVLREISESVDGSSHLVSINGSVLLEHVASICPNRKVSRIMPSMTAEVNSATTLVCHNDLVTEQSRNDLYELLTVYGSVQDVPEDQMGIASEFTSCMPGFISSLFKIIVEESMRHTTIPESDVRDMIIATLYGTSKLLRERSMDFDDLMARVVTKGGITEEGIRVIEDRFPSVMATLYQETIDKRKRTARMAMEQFVGQE